MSDLSLYDITADLRARTHFMRELARLVAQTIDLANGRVLIVCLKAQI
jgi:hypothetical protein